MGDHKQQQKNNYSARQILNQEVVFGGQDVGRDDKKSDDNYVNPQGQDLVNDGGQQKGGSVSNDNGGVISLKGGQTQREIDEQKRIENLKSKAIKLERRLTPKEKELERMQKSAIKVEDKQVIQPQVNLANLAKVDNSKMVDNFKGTDVTEQEQNNLEKNKAFKQREILKEKEAKKVLATVKQDNLAVENISTDSSPKTVGSEKSNTEQPSITQSVLSAKQIPKAIIDKPVVEQKSRMVISPDGKISRKIISTQSNIVKEKNSAVDLRLKQLKEDNKGVDKNTLNLKGGVDYENKQKDKSNNDFNVSKVDDKVDSKVDSKVDLQKKEQGDLSKIVNLSQASQLEGKKLQERKDVKVDLKKMSPEKRITMQATPSLASINWEMDNDTNKEVVAWFDEYNELPINIKLGLSDAKTRQKIKEFAKNFNLIGENNLGEVSRIIRDVYVKLIKEVDVRKRLVNNLKVKEKEINNALRTIGEVVQMVKDVGNQKNEEYFERLSIKQILKKYKEVENQNVTEGMLVEKTTGEYVNSTIQNWIDDYINRAGSLKHTHLERGKYLNDSVNTRELNYDERKRVEKLVKSYDEETKLIIDKDEKYILWNMHSDESQLGINSDKSKRVINNFKIEEAQSIDTDEDNKIVKLKKEKKKDIIRNEEVILSQAKQNVTKKSEKGGSLVSSVDLKTLEKKGISKRKWKDEDEVLLKIRKPQLGDLNSTHLEAKSKRLFNNKMMGEGANEMIKQDNIKNGRQGNKNKVVITEETIDEELDLSSEISKIKGSFVDSGKTKKEEVKSYDVINL